MIEKNIKKTMKVWDKEYKKGFTSYLVLLLLKNSPMYGYQLKNELEALTNKVVTYQEGGIYQVLKKLKGNGFLTSQSEKSSKGPDRKIYSLTESGEQLLDLFTSQYVLPIHMAIFDLINKTFGSNKNHSKEN